MRWNVFAKASESLNTTTRFSYIMYTHLERVEDKAKVIRTIEDTIEDGEITLSDWMKIGNRLGLKRK
jgi:hypothetical protein|tara:strand:+ start:179 stop:379 length:201 start_codon:yes stop_codon:yes gene_type:complete